MAPEGDVLGVELAPPRGGGLALELVFQQGGELLPVLFSGVALLEAGVGLELGDVQDLAHRLPLLLLVGGDVDEAVQGAEGAGGGGGEVVVAHEHRAPGRR